MGRGECWRNIRRWLSVTCEEVAAIERLLATDAVASTAEAFYPSEALLVLEIAAEEERSRDNVLAVTT